MLATVVLSAAVCVALMGVVLATSDASGALGDCAQPASSGDGPVASDCLFVLRVAVGSSTCAPLCICDTTGDGATFASDALLCLRKAVGQSVELACACGSNLFVNGDFEKPVMTSGSNGWDFVNVQGVGWAGTDGNPGAHFVINQSGQPATDPTLSQTVDGLEVGEAYRVSGDYRSYAPSFGDPLKTDAFAVAVAPVSGGPGPSVIFAIGRPSPDPNVWTPFEAEFVAAASTTTIYFIAERDGDDSSFDVDNIRLEAE